MALCMMTAKAFAMVNINPIYVDFNANDNKRTQTLSVINNTSKPQTYQISWKNYKEDETGAKKELTEVPDFAASKYLMFAPKQFTLKPGKTQNIRLVMKSMANAEDGEYTSYLHVSERLLGLPEGEKEENGEFAIGIKFLMAAAVPVSIVKGDLTQETEIVDYKKDGNKFEVRLARKGERTSHINLSLLNEDGEEVGYIGNIHIRSKINPSKYSFSLDENKKLPKFIKLEDANTKKEILRKDISL